MRATLGGRTVEKPALLGPGLVECAEAEEAEEEVESTYSAPPLRAIVAVVDTKRPEYILRPSWAASGGASPRPISNVFLRLLARIIPALLFFPGSKTACGYPKFHIKTSRQSALVITAGFATQATQNLFPRLFFRTQLRRSHRTHRQRGSC